MGNKFKLSDIIPNAWFYKLKRMTKTSKKTNSNNSNNNNTETTPKTTTKVTPNKPNTQEPPRKSSKRRSTSSRQRKPAVKTTHSRLVSSSNSTEISSSSPEWEFSLNHNNNVKRGTSQLKDDVDLPPILTKPINFDDTIFEARSRTNKSSSSSYFNSPKCLSVKVVRESEKITTQRSQVSAGIRLRVNSPRLACARKSVSFSRNRKYLSESLAVVKASVDPQRDFRESMVEMIVENNIRASKDLEELLACFLTLNSKEYHDVIVKAFEQIWFDMAHLRV